MSRWNKLNKPIHYVIIISSIILLTIIMIISLYIRQIHNWEKSEKEAINRIKRINKPSDEIIINEKTDDFSNDVNENYNLNNSNIITNNLDDVINNNISIDTTKKDHSDISDTNEDCIIEISDINLSKIVYSGKNREKHLDKYELVTAASDMKYSQGGNYIICGHASRLYGHSLNRLKEIKVGTLIDIWSNGKMDQYTVNKVYYIDMNDTDKYCKQNNKKELTIVSCAKYISYNSYIVIKAIPK